MEDPLPEPMDRFEIWPLTRVAHPVEAGEVPAERLELVAARVRPQEEGQAAAIQHIADLLPVQGWRGLLMLFVGIALLSPASLPVDATPLRGC